MIEYGFCFTVKLTAGSHGKLNGLLAVNKQPTQPVLLKYQDYVI